MLLDEMVPAGCAPDLVVHPEGHKGGRDAWAGGCVFLSNVVPFWVCYGFVAGDSSTPKGTALESPGIYLENQPGLVAH